MHTRYERLFFLSVLLSIFLVEACTNSSLSGSDSTADEQVAASMSSTEAGATYAVSADVEQTSAGTAQATGTTTSGTITIVVEAATYSVTYYNGYDGGGSLISTNPASVPSGWKSAVLSSTRPYEVTAPHGDGSSSIASSLTINNYAASSGLYTLSGTITVERAITLSSGTEVNTTTTHSLSYSVSATTGAIQKGGTATTSCSASIDGGAAFTRSYSWVFEGDGSAVLTTERGTTITVTVE